MKISFLFLALGWVLIALQGIAAWHDGYFSQSQMYAAKIFNGYSFLSHINIWTDVILITPIVAIIGARHDINYLSDRSWILLGVTLIAGAAFILKDIAITRTIFTAFARDGYITLPGWIHLLYFIGSLWIILVYYFAPGSRNHYELIGFAIAFLIYSWTMFVKFPTSVWKEIDGPALYMAAGETVLLGVATYLKW